MASSSVSLRRLDVTIDDANVEPGMLEVMQALRPEWKSEDIKYKVSLTWVRLVDWGGGYHFLRNRGAMKKLGGHRIFSWKIGGLQK